MKSFILPLSLIASAAVGVLAADLKIEVTQEVECDRKTRKGDMVEAHYKGTLAADGSKFDASYDRGVPFSFKLGSGQVIQGWEEGMLDMCIGEKRTLTIPPEKGYGNRGMGPIPGGSTLVFETELVGIKGVPKPEKIVKKSAGSESASASGAAEKASEGVAEKVASAASGAAEVVETLLVDTDDAQEHNEL